MAKQAEQQGTPTNGAKERRTRVVVQVRDAEGKWTDEPEFDGKFTKATDALRPVSAWAQETCEIGGEKRVRVATVYEITATKEQTVKTAVTIA